MSKRWGHAHSGRLRGLLRLWLWHSTLPGVCYHPHIHPVFGDFQHRTTAELSLTCAPPHLQSILPSTTLWWLAFAAVLTNCSPSSAPLGLPCTYLLAVPSTQSLPLPTIASRDPTIERVSLICWAYTCGASLSRQTGQRCHVPGAQRAAHASRMGMPVSLVPALVRDVCD